MTVKEAEVLGFCTRSRLKGNALAHALALHKGVATTTAQAAINRLVAKGLLLPSGTPQPALQLLADVGRFLAARQWPVQDAEAVMMLRERVAEVLR